MLFGEGKVTFTENDNDTRTNESFINTEQSSVMNSHEFYGIQDKIIGQSVKNSNQNSGPMIYNYGQHSKD